MNVTETEIKNITISIKNQILEQFQQEPTGIIRGYLVLNEPERILSSRRKEKIAVQNNTNSLQEMVIAYIVRNELMDFFQDYPFEKFQICLETFPRYKKMLSGLFPYHRTDEFVTFLKADIKW